VKRRGRGARGRLKHEEFFDNLGETIAEAETRVKIIRFVFAMAALGILGMAGIAPGFAQQGGQNGGSGSRNAGSGEISSPDRAGSRDQGAVGNGPGGVGPDPGRGGTIEAAGDAARKEATPSAAGRGAKGGAPERGAPEPGALDHGASEHRVTDHGGLHRIAGPVMPDGVYINSRLNSRRHAERKSPGATAADKTPAPPGAGARHWSGERRNAAGAAARNAVGAVLRKEGNRPSPSGLSAPGAAEHAGISPESVRTGAPQTAAAGRSAIGGAGTSGTASAGTGAIAGVDMPALTGADVHHTMGYPGTGGPQPAHVTGINGTSFGHVGIGPGSVGGPAKNPSGINGTNFRPRF
jgi:hypothetical protein